MRFTYICTCNTVRRSMFQTRQWGTWAAFSTEVDLLFLYAKCGGLAGFTGYHKWTWLSRRTGNNRTDCRNLEVVQHCVEGNSTRIEWLHARVRLQASETNSSLCLLSNSSPMHLMLLLHRWTRGTTFQLRSRDSTCRDKQTSRTEVLVSRNRSSQ